MPVLDAATRTDGCRKTRRSPTGLDPLTARLVPTLAESIDRQSNVPILGLTIALALRALRGEPGGSGVGPTRSSIRRRDDAVLRLCHESGDRLRLFNRLLCALPGGAAAIRESELPDFQGCEGAGERAGLLDTWRQECAAVDEAAVAPVSIGAGPGLAFVRECRHDVVLVAANLGAQPHELQCDLNGYQGRQIVDILEGRLFPDVSNSSLYPLFLAGYTCHWLRLVRGGARAGRVRKSSPHRMPFPAAERYIGG